VRAIIGVTMTKWWRIWDILYWRALMVH